eukprot:1161503-Pelagomonas_calceolata.AAC.5
MGILASGNKGKRHTSHLPTRTAVLLWGRGTVSVLECSAVACVAQQTVRGFYFSVPLLVGSVPQLMGCMSRLQDLGRNSKLNPAVFGWFCLFSIAA